MSLENYHEEHEKKQEQIQELINTLEQRKDQLLQKENISQEELIEVKNQIESEINKKAQVAEHVDDDCLLSIAHEMKAIDIDLPVERKREMYEAVEALDSQVIKARVDAKIQIGEVLYKDLDASNFDFENLKQNFKKLYLEFLEIRKQLIDNKESPEILSSLKSKKYELGKLSQILYSNSENYEEFINRIKEIFIDIKGIDEKDFNEYFSATFLYPANLKPIEDKEYLPGPFESIISTIECLKVAEKVRDSVSDSCSSLLFSGSSIWGSFYATKGQVPQEAGDYMLEQRKLKNISDTDFVSIFEDFNSMEAGIKKLVADKIISEDSVQRFEEFIKLKKDKKVNYLSCRGEINGIETSMHFFDKETFSSLSGFIDSINPEIDDSLVFSDFRKDRPKGTGYELINPNEDEKSEKIEFEDLGGIKSVEQGNIVPVVFLLENNKNFYLGLIPTQLMQSPIKMIDKDGFVEDISKKLKDFIIKNGGNPDSIIKKLRASRLPPEFLES